MEQFVVNTGIYIGYVLVGLAVLAVIVLPLINALGNPKTLIKSVIGLIVLGCNFLDWICFVRLRSNSSVH